MRTDCSRLLFFGAAIFAAAANLIYSLTEGEQVAWPLISLGVILVAGLTTERLNRHINHQFNETADAEDALRRHFLTPPGGRGD